MGGDRLTRNVHPVIPASSHLPLTSFFNLLPLLLPVFQYLPLIFFLLSLTHHPLSTCAPPLPLPGSLYFTLTSFLPFLDLSLYLPELLSLAPSIPHSLVLFTVPFVPSFLFPLHYYFLNLSLYSFYLPLLFLFLSTVEEAVGQKIIA